jgi:hypothetical protein
MDCIDFLVRIAYQRQQMLHSLQIERIDVVTQVLFLLVIGPVKKIPDGIIVCSEGLFWADCRQFRRRPFGLFLPSFDNAFCHKKNIVTQKLVHFNPIGLLIA